MEYWEAVELLNDITEHRWGSGPLGDRDADGDKARKAAFRRAKTQRLASDADLAQIKSALGL